MALSLGHALTVALMRARNFGVEDFERFHPGGHLGRSLRLVVRDVMHGREEIAIAYPGDSLKQVVIAMTHYPHGAACVVDAFGRLMGLVTDGDVRRALQAQDDIRGQHAGEVMTKNPSTVVPDARLQEALRLIEDRPSQISVLPVVDPASGRCLGLLRPHNINRSGIGPGT